MVPLGSGSMVPPKQPERGQTGAVPGSLGRGGWACVCWSLDCLHGTDMLGQQHDDYSACGPRWPQSRAVAEDDSSRHALQANTAAQRCRAGRLQLSACQGPWSLELYRAGCHPPPFTPKSPQRTESSPATAAQGFSAPGVPHSHPQGQLELPQRGLGCDEGLGRAPEWTGAGRDFQDGGKAVIVRGCSPSRPQIRRQRKPVRQESPSLGAFES